jgi:hypothetical protein
MTTTVSITTNASGAVEAAQRGHVVMIVDVISMSTTLEGAIEAGAAKVYGASPDVSRAPVNLNPEVMGEIAGKKALELGTDVILISEPRVGTDDERKKNAAKAIAGIKKVGASLGAVVPNLGAETVKLVDFKGRVVIAVTDTGGVAFDAAVQAGSPSVIVGTIARTVGKRGKMPAVEAAKRAVKEAQRLNTGITVVAASGNSLEDVLAAEYIGRTILEIGFSKL